MANSGPEIPQEPCGSSQRLHVSRAPFQANPPPSLPPSLVVALTQWCTPPLLAPPHFLSLGLSVSQGCHKESL